MEYFASAKRGWLLFLNSTGELYIKSANRNDHQAVAAVSIAYNWRHFALDIHEYCSSLGH